MKLWTTILQDEQFMNMNPTERFVWVGLLCLSGDGHYPGKVCITENMGYSLEQLSELLKVQPRDIQNTILGMKESLSIDKKGVISILQWEKYQSEWMRVSKYIRKTTPKTTPKTNTQNYTVEGEVEVDVQKENKIQKLQNIYIQVLDLWNYHKIITHKKLTDKEKGKINAKTEQGHTLEEILTAIDNYACILEGRDFFFKYRWTLADFLQRGFDKFKDLEIAKTNYGRKTNDFGKDKPANLKADAGKYDNLKTIR